MKTVSRQIQKNKTERKKQNRKEKSVLVCEGVVCGEYSAYTCIHLC